MYDYDRALAIAKKEKPNIDYCVEYENAYLFGARSEELSFGGEGSPVVILKRNGQAIGQTEYYDTDATDVVREFDI